MKDDAADDGELLSALSDELLVAHRRVAALQVDADEKARATRRLLAISDAAKHDIGRAHARLQRFLADLDGGAGPSAGA